MRLFPELIFGSNTSDGTNITSYGEYIDSLRSRMQRAHTVARQHLGEVAHRSKQTYDSKISFNIFEVGSLVWCLAEARKVGVCPKLEHSYEGPYLIKVKDSDLTYTLLLDNKNKEKLVHHNKLKPYEGCNPPRWIVQAKGKIHSNL